MDNLEDLSQLRARAERHHRCLIAIWEREYTRWEAAGLCRLETRIRLAVTT